MRFAFEAASCHKGIVRFRREASFFADFYNLFGLLGLAKCDSPFLPQVAAYQLFKAQNSIFWT